MIVVCAWCPAEEQPVVPEGEQVSHGICEKCKSEMLRQSGVLPGWLPDDDLTREFVGNIAEYRKQCDEEDQLHKPDEADLMPCPYCGNSGEHLDDCYLTL